jgi:O-antigen ligase
MTTFEVARAESPSLNRGVLLGAALALLFSANAVFVLVYGLAGVAGNSLFTGALLVLSEAAIFLLCFRRITLLPADYLFGAFLVCIAASFAINGRTADLKETALLIVSLAAYPACRFVAHSTLDKVKTGFSGVTAALVLIGAILTALAIFDQWPVPQGKPAVFGFYAAATHFLGALAFCILALVTMPLTIRRTAVISALLFLPVAIFAASMVRFTFIALLGGLCLAVILSAGPQRLYVATITAVMLVGVAAGLASRFDATKVLMDYTIQKNEVSAIQKRSPAESPISSVPPSCNLDVNLNNSVAIRKALLSDAFYLIPYAGLFGMGLDSFLSVSCVAGHQVHNSILQTAVEFGWLGGLSLLLLIGVAGYRLLPLSRKDDGARFIFCSLAYVTTVSMAHGRISHDLLLFALAGLAVGIYETKRVLELH